MKKITTLFTLLSFFQACAPTYTEETIQKCQESRKSNAAIGFYNPFTQKIDTTAEEIYIANKGGGKFNDMIFFEKKNDLMFVKTLNRHGADIFVERSINKVEWDNIVSKFNKIGFWCIEKEPLKPSRRVYDGGGFSLEGKKGVFRHTLYVQDPHYDDKTTQANDAIQGDKKRIEKVVDELFTFGAIDSIIYPQIIYERKDSVLNITISPHKYLAVKTFEIYIDGKMVQLTDNSYKMVIKNKNSPTIEVICKTVTNKNEKVYYRNVVGYFDY